MSHPSLLRLLLLPLLVCLAGSALAQTEARSPDPSAVASVKRPRIGLVLSGGGARGLAHVGVLKVLERERVPIDVIAGTSMGAIIGGLYASGMSADEIERELGTVDWDALFASRIDRAELSQRRREQDFIVTPAIEFGLRDGSLRLPLGARSTRGLELLLRRYTLPVRTIDNFDDLPTPFRAVATDMETGEAIVLGSGDLAMAMRSSMSVPGAFAPTEVDNRILGDGGLVNNLPIDVARAMGADVVIVVNIGTPLGSRSSLVSAVGLTSQMINILTEQNVQRSLATLGPADVLIAPVLGNLGSGDFEQAATLMALGEAGARGRSDRLATLAQSGTAGAGRRRCAGLRSGRQTLGARLPACRSGPQHRLWRPQRLQPQAQPQPPLADAQRYRMAQPGADRRGAATVHRDLPPAGLVTLAC